MVILASRLRVGPVEAPRIELSSGSGENQMQVVLLLASYLLRVAI